MARESQQALTDVSLIDGVRSDDNRSKMRRVASASFVGSLVEFYDFNIYGYASALFFGKIFFPALGPAAGTVAAFATLGVAFVARPVGSILFGHFGDRLGRKRTLVTTLLIMGVSTCLVGLMPTVEQIGVAAPILLVVLRILQGLAAGGEWAGAALFAVENAPAPKRGFWAMFASLGGGAALTLAPATFLVTGFAMSDADFAAYGWRIPFITSLVLIAVGLYIRLRMEESAIFTKERDHGGVPRVPLLEAFRRQRREVLLAGGAMIIPPSFGYLGASYMSNYGATALGLGRTEVLALGVIGGLALTFGIWISGFYSDRFGRRTIILAAAIVAVPWALVLFPLMKLGSSGMFGACMCITMFISGCGLGPMSAFMSELFHTRYRYTAAGFSYNIAQIIGGAGTPLLAAWMTPRFGGLTFGVYLAVLSVISLVCVLKLSETKDYDLSRNIPQS
ncbi:general substrate transporter [Caballeronia temeraria]|uniref:General substrate transporter n=1 Tax=Caballeronia temeraria TaxID=1777137 RepID=A0A158DY52_9BURK|nr:MFS transporter [Caballeronia temeraria]SAK99106.1 general substrate transporter [Caballeronia temeraria]